jgi:uncharacterized membrane protein (UPF0182 family)
MQIEARVDQQTEISRELSLWDQRGSRVIRGNLLAIPVSDSFIYVEPIYLEAKQEGRQALQATTPQSGGKPRQQQGIRPTRGAVARTAALPELKRIIVALGSRVAMEKTLDEALRRVLWGEATPGKEIVPAIPETEEISELGVLALKYYNNAKDYLREGDWAGYGRELEKLENILKQLSESTEDAQ